MNKIIMTGAVFLFSKLMQGVASFQEPAGNLAKIKIASVYLQIVKISRLMFLSILGSGICLVLLLVGLALIHYTILFYTSWDISVKVTISLASALLYISTAVGIFIYVFSEDKWLRMFNTEKTIKELTEK